MYVWNESVALELSLASNGWFRYLITNKLYTMYSSGTPEQCSEKNGILLINSVRVFCVVYFSLRRLVIEKI